jgi:hypothetical protein
MWKPDGVAVAEAASGKLKQDSRRRLIRWVCWAIIVFGCVCRIYYICRYNPMDNLFSDPQRHWEQGVDVLRADPMTMTDPVLYQLFISALARLTLQYPPLVAFYTILLSLATPWIWYRFLRELLPGKTQALAGWALISLIPSWISIYCYFMQETLMLPLLGTALWATWRCRRKGTVSSFLWVVVLWALAGLTRGIAIPLAAVAALWLLLTQKQKLRKTAFGLLVLLLILGPLTVRSYHFAHIFAPHGMGNMNMLYAKSGKRTIRINYEREGARWYYIFQSPALEAEPFEPFSDWQSSREGTLHLSVDLDQGGQGWKRAFARYPLTVGKYLKLTADNLALLFFTESWPDSNRQRLIGEINYQSRWLWAPLTLFVFIGVVIRRRRLRGQWLLPALLLAWFVVQGLLPIAVNEGRYRMPFLGLLVAQSICLVGKRGQGPVLSRSLES